MTMPVAHDPKKVPDWVQALTISGLDHDTDAVFARLRAEAPLTWIPALNAWIATTWELCEEIATDAQRFVGGTSPMVDRLFGRPHILGSDGALHATLRAVIDGPLSPRSFRSRLEDHVRPVAKAALESLSGRRETELMADYFEPVSVRCVADTFGFDTIPTDQLRAWFHELAVASTNTTDANGEFINPHGFDGADRVREQVRAYLEGIAERESAEPDNGHFSHLFRSGMPEGQMRSVDELLPSFLIVFLGGVQEPGHACGTTFLALATHPEAQRQVVDDLKLLPRAISEALRWMSPNYAGGSRLVGHDMTFGGQELRKGETIWLAYGSANQDDSVFEAAGTFDLNRAQHPHLAFGAGDHRCPGSALSPQIARIALEELYTAHPDVRLDPARVPTPRGWLFRAAPDLHVVL